MRTELARQAPVAERLRAADLALDALERAVRALPNAEEACSAALHREAVASAALEGWATTLTDLLLFERGTSATQDSDRPDRGGDGALVKAERILQALAHGRRRVTCEGRLTARIMHELLLCLLPPAADIPASVAMVIDALEPVTRRGADGRLRVAVAAEVGGRLAHLRTSMKECGPLSRIAALLVLCAGECRCVAALAPSVHGLRRETIPARASSRRAGLAVDALDADDPEAIGEFADEIRASAVESVATIAKAAALFDADEEKIAALGKAAHSARRVHRALQGRPVVSLPRLIEGTELRVQAATSAMHRLRALGIVREVTGGYRHRIYTYDAYLAILDHGLPDAARQR